MSFLNFYTIAIIAALSFQSIGLNAATSDDLFDTTEILEAVKHFECGKQGYIDPNEYYPENILIAMPEESPIGKRALVAVGSERAFLEAAILPGVEALLTFDIDTRVVAYNRFNTLLLRMSQSRVDYLRLRNLDKDSLVEEVRGFEYWKNYNVQDRNFVENPIPYVDLWVYYQAQPGMKLLNTSTAEQKIFARRHSYLFDGGKFNCLKRMADEQLIHSFLADATDQAAQSKLAMFLQRMGFVPFIIDLSNIPTLSFFGDKEKRNFAEDWHALFPMPRIVYTLPTVGAGCWDFTGRIERTKKDRHSKR